MPLKLDTACETDLISYLVVWAFLTSSRMLYHTKVQYALCDGPLIQ